MRSDPLLLIMRHGETELNAKDAFRGWLDVPLTQEGRQQAKNAAAFLQKYPIAAIFHSPLGRAEETSRIVSRGQPIQSSDGLKPWNVGVLSGKPKEPYMKVRDYYLDHPDRRIPRGESVNEFEQRFTPLLEEGIRMGQSGKLPLFVAHTSNIAAADGLLSGVRGRLEDMDSVHPGGVAGVFANGTKFELRPLFRAAGSKQAVS